MVLSGMMSFWLRIILISEVLELRIEMIGPEDLAELEERGLGLVVVTGVDEGADLSVPASGEADEPGGVDPQ